MIGGSEKWIAEFLKKHPYLRQIFSYSYRKINYHIYGRIEFSYDLHEGVSIKVILSRDNNSEAFFGYHDKSPWSFDSRYYLVHVSDRRELEFIDKTPAFNYQQGAILRWLNQKSYQRIYNLKTNKLLTVGVFFAPLKYDKAYRCDLHPRWSPDGTKISIDSAHEGFRNSYIIDVTKLVSKNDEYLQ